MGDTGLKESHAAETAPAADESAHLRAFLIVDIRGYTSFTVVHGDAAAGRLAGDFAALVREAVTGHGGEVFGLLGDQALAVFTSARKSMAAAIELQARLESRPLTELAESPGVGVGIDAGEAVPVEDGDFRGTALNLAARLCSLAAPGEILVSETVKNLAGRVDGIEYHSRGSAELKGFELPVPVFGVRGVSPHVPAPAMDPALIRTPQRLPIGGFLGSLAAEELVGRRSQREEARTMAARAQQGQGQMALVLGEAGVGKTRLAQEITLLLRDEGFLIAAGSCYQDRQSTPLYPFLDVVATLFGLCSEPLKRDLLGRWPALKRLLPLETANRREPSDDEADRIFWSVGALINEMATHHPIAILLDDLHWADGSTLELLRHLARHVRLSRVFIMGIYRDAEVGAHHPLEGTLREIARDDLATRIPVRRLDETETRELASRILKIREPGERFLRALYERTEGNPFFVRHVLRMANSVAGGEGTHGISDLEVPESIRSVVGQRLSHLGEEAQTALRKISIVGQRFSWAQAVALSGMEEEPLDELLTRACGAGLLATAEGQSYSFDHALTHQTLYLENSPRQRRGLHRLAGELLEQERSKGGRVSPADLAWHFGEADDPVQAIRYGIETATEAQAVYAHADAETHLRTALALSRETGDHRHEAEAWERLGHTLNVTSRFEEAGEALETALGLYGRLEDQEGRFRTVASLGERYAKRFAFEEGLRVVRPAAAEISRLEPSPGGVMVEIVFSTLLGGWGEFEESERVAASAAAIARQLKDPVLMVRADERHALALAINRTESATAEFEKVVETAEAIGDVDTMLRGLKSLRTLYFLHGDIAAEEGCLRRMVEVSETLGPSELALAWNRLGWAKLIRGEFSEARLALEEATGLAAEIDGPLVGEPFAYLGELQWLEGDTDGAMAYLARWSQRADATDSPSAVLTIESSLALIEETEGRAGAARSRLLRILERLGDRAPHYHSFRTKRRLASATAEIDAAEAMEILTELTEALSPGGDYRESLWQVESHVLKRLEGGGEPPESLQKSLTVYERRGARLQLAEIHLTYGSACLEAGDFDEARSHLESAESLSAAIGAVPFARRAAQLLTEMP